MARGRMLNNKISTSLQFHHLPDDTCRLLATWTISHLDKNGVFHGDPVVVKSYVFPRRGDISVEQVAQYLQAMANAVDGDGQPMVVLFEARGDTWQWWPQFAQNQPGLRPERESTSFPMPPAECRQDVGKMTDECRQDDGKMPAEEKGKEVKGSKDPAPDGAPPPEPEHRTPPTPHQAMFGALLTVYKWDLELITEKQRGRLNSESKRLIKASKTPEQVWHAGEWWWENDWRGQKGSTPTYSQLVETLGKVETQAAGPAELGAYQ